MVQLLSKPDKAVKYICEFLKSCPSSFLKISFIINETMSLSSHHNSKFFHSVVLHTVYKPFLKV